MWGVNMKLKIMVIIGLLFLLVVAGSMQLQFHSTHQILLDRINEEKGTFLGLVLSTASDETRLLSSADFVVDSSTPCLTFAGRQFNIGKFHGISTVYVIAKSPLKWEKSTTVEADNLLSLRFGDYNHPEEGENKLASVEYLDVLQYTPSSSDNKQSFWFPADKFWFQAASHLKA